MTAQMKFLSAGILLLILLTAVALMMRGKADSLSSSTPAVVSEKGADSQKKDPVTVSPGQTAEEARKVESTRASRESPQVGTAVSQAQIELMTKREEARIRRDKMMQERANTINKLGPGNTGQFRQ